MKRIAPLVVTLAAMFSFLLATPKQASQKNYRPAVQEYVLENGMKVLMLVKPGVPRVVCHIYYKVGSINERPGITGLAHLHEHMMFKGTRMMGVSDFEKDDALNQRIDSLMEQVYKERFWKQKGDAAKADALEKEAEALMKEEKQYIIKDHLWETLMRNGGTGLNASTGNESTGYYVTLPSNKVELQMLLEADRMQNAYYREFYSEKNVVMEERRLSENLSWFSLRRTGKLGFLRRFSLQLGRDRLDGRPEEGHKERSGGVSQPLLCPQQRSRRLRWRF